MTPEQDTAQEALQPEVTEVKEDGELTPAQQETAEKLGVKQEEKETKEEYGKRVQKRINDEVRKRHDKERELEAYISQSRKDFEAMAETNKKLQETVERMTKATETIVEQTKPKPVDKVKEIDVSIKSLKQKKAEALENADFKSVSIIDDQLDDLKDRRYEAKLEQELSKTTANLEKSVAESKKKNGDDEIPIEVQIWAKETPWYDKDNDAYDEVMEAAAIKIYDRVVNDPAWSKKSLKNQLAEIRRRTEEKFHYGKKAPPVSTVEGVDGYSTAAAKTVTLSDDQKYVAVRMFPNLSPKDAEKKYASQLK